MANTPPVRLSRVSALAAPVKMATGAEAVVEPAAVGAGTVKVAMPPMGAATVTVLLGAPELSAGAAEEAELKGPNAVVTLAVEVEPVGTGTTAAAGAADAEEESEEMAEERAFAVEDDEGTVTGAVMVDCPLKYGRTTEVT